MPENPWTAADIAMASVKVQQHLFSLLVHKGVLTEQELEHMMTDLVGKVDADAGGEGVAAFLRRAFHVPDKA